MSKKDFAKMYNKLTKKITFNLFGIKLKFQLPIKSKNQDVRFENLLYELADPRTLASIKLPRVLNTINSINALVNSNKSLVRYGDGEFKIMFGESINFQQHDPELAKKLKEIIKNKNDKVFVGIPDTFGFCPNNYFRKLLVHIRAELYKYISFENDYLDSFITRQYKFLSKESGEKYYNLFKQLWADKDVVIIEGLGTHLGIGNNLFDNAKSIQRIVCPNMNAYSKYNEIFNEANKQAKDKLFLLALGPTATVLAYELAQLGYRALDIGHLDIMYEMFLKDAQTLIPLENKIVFNNERKNKKFEHCEDPKYYEQLIADFSK